MPWMNITCGRCFHEGDLDTFTATPIYGDLPPNTVQCPACGIAIEKRVSGPGQRYESGLYVHGPVELVVVESRM
jgi:hypothetical protein